MTAYKTLALVGIACTAMFGCNTIRGAGQDVQKGGEIIQGAARNMDLTDRFTISTSASPGGSISPSETAFLSMGGSRTFTFYPDTGYHVVDVIVDGRSLGPRSEYTFSNVRSNHSISVAFGLNR